MVQDFKKVSDHFTTLRSKGLKTIKVIYVHPEYAAFTWGGEKILPVVEWILWENNLWQCFVTIYVKENSSGFTFRLLRR